MAILEFLLHFREFFERWTLHSGHKLCASVLFLSLDCASDITHCPAPVYKTLLLCILVVHFYMNSKSSILSFLCVGVSPWWPTDVLLTSPVKGQKGLLTWQNSRYIHNSGLIFYIKPKIYMKTFLAKGVKQAKNKTWPEELWR